MPSETLNCGCGSNRNKRGKCLKVLTAIVGGIKSLVSIVTGITLTSCVADNIDCKIAIQQGITLYYETTCAPYTDGLPILRSVEQIILRDKNGNILRAQPLR